MFIFFFKQKTAYEMRISDWSSDVCSSDLKAAAKLSLPSAHGIFSPHPPGQHQHQRKNEGAGHAEEPKQEVGDPCPDRKSVVKGTSVSVRVDLGGRRIIKKKNRRNRKMRRIDRST